MIFVKGNSPFDMIDKTKAKITLNMVNTHKTVMDKKVETSPAENSGKRIMSKTIQTCSAMVAKWIILPQPKLVKNQMRTMQSTIH